MISCALKVSPEQAGEIIKSIDEEYEGYLEYDNFVEYLKLLDPYFTKDTYGFFTANDGAQPGQTQS